MVIPKDTEASALAEPEHTLGQAAAPLDRPPQHGETRLTARDDGQQDEESRSRAFVYVIVAFVIGLGAIGWAVSAFL
jgi:hypothetical protein